MRFRDRGLTPVSKTGRTTGSLLALSLCVLAALPNVAHAAAEGKVAINYNRCDKSYDGWGLHVWANPATPLPGVSWGTPMKPAGTNDFGIYWEADLSEFGATKTVNYIIHKGDSKDQGARDMKFDANKVKEIWVNNGDQGIYTSLEDAKTARAAKPCA